VEADLGVGAEHVPPVRGRRAGFDVHGLENAGRNRAFEELLSGRGVIAKIAPGAGLILHLDHQHGALWVGRLEVTHESGKSLGVGVERGSGEGRRRIERAAVLVDHARIAFGVQLHPLRHIVRVAVLPGAEPKQDQAQPVGASLSEQSVDDAVIELPLLGLDLLPVDRDLDCVGVQELHGRPNSWEHGGPTARVVHLRAQDEVGRAIDK